MKTILRAENICKNEILNDISFTVEEGEMVAIMGPSGSGKSTLLYNLSGMDTPTSGKVYIDDKEITSLSEKEKAAVRLNKIGFVFQQMNMMENLNIIDNILLPAVEYNRENKNGKKDKEELRKRALGLMEKLSIADLYNRKISEVSGGQLQRSCICRSMINSPEIIFADEPTGALNKSATKEVMSAMSALNKEGTTILMVTHDSKLASRCNRVLYILDGQIKGEYRFEGNDQNNDKEREEKLACWLSDYDW